MEPLSSEQLAAGELQPRPVAVVVAGAGSGKTRVLASKVHRDQMVEIDPRKQIVVTFTNKAAGELRARLGPAADELRHLGTVHSWALREMRRARLQGVDSLEMISDKAFDLIVREEAKRMKWKGTLAEARELATASRRLAGNPRVVGAAIMARCQREGVLHPDLILGFFRGRIDEIDLPAGCRLYVDEYQDTSPTEHEIYQICVKDKAATAYLVGDMRQAVYGFRGASPVLLDQAWKDHPGSRAELVDNYRSEPRIVDLANETAAGMQLPEGSTATMRPIKSDTPTGAITFQRYVTAEAEAEEIADWLKHFHDRHRQAGSSTPWGQVAILVRFNQQALQIAGVLQAHRIPVTCTAWKEDKAAELMSDRRIVELANLAGTDPNWAAEMIKLEVPLQLQEELLNGGHLDSCRQPEDLLAVLRGELGLERDRVAVSTVHSAKGLEWPHVWLAGADHQAFPEDEESRRLLYVAITRAERILTISAASSRQAHRRLLDLQPTKLITR